MKDLDPIDGAVLAVLLLARGARAVLVPLVALVLTLAGWQPRRIFRPLPVPAYVSPTVEQLRRQVRALRGPAYRPGGRRIAQARRADLLAAMGAI